jgi:hypothetical protein
MDSVDYYRFPVQLATFYAKVWKWTSKLRNDAQQCASISNYCSLLRMYAQHYVMNGCTIMRNIKIASMIPILRIIVMALFVSNNSHIVMGT